MSIASRLEKLEAKRPSTFVPGMSFIWTGPHNDAALERAQQEADAKGCELMVIRLVPPAMAPDGKAVRS